MIAKIFIATLGILNILAGFIEAYRHGKPRGEYNGVGGVIDALIGVALLLVAFGVIK